MCDLMQQGRSDDDVSWSGGTGLPRKEEVMRVLLLQQGQNLIAYAVYGDEVAREWARIVPAVSRWIVPKPDRFASGE
ncbi:hypothetical protein [Verrucomicrobium spinosum]|uniref:hypothetical protein n=1 Tax=Verrucomicrobium spinosum TaxID=2736 RepID=UPI001C45BBE4|nr:hypothetical protein [Verrucomicrobium spinosum]